MLLYIIRHGEPAYPADDLTPRGHQQAQLLAQRLAHCGVSAIYSSPMVRALATAQYTAHRLALPIAVESWMQELESWTIVQAPEAEYPAWGVAPHTIRSSVLQRHDWEKVPPLHANLRLKFAGAAAAFRCLFEPSRL